MGQPGGHVPQSRQPQLIQLNLLLPVETLLADLPQDRQQELSLALAKLLLRAAGVEVKDDES
jgi:hypothetical protein